MRLFVLGATGRTGQHLLDLGLARGHEITAFVRSPQKIARKNRALTIVKGDPLDVGQLAAVLPGHDAVLSAIGPAPRDALRPSKLMTECATAALAAMNKVAVPRFLVVSSALLFPDGRLLFRFFRWLIRHHLRDLEVMEATIHESGLDYTIARPPRLVERSDEAYRSADGALPEDAWSMSFRAVAAFVLDSAAQRTHLRDTVGLAAAS
jgi:putative NADH-flavin reductase